MVSKIVRTFAAHFKTTQKERRITMYGEDYSNVFGMIHFQNKDKWHCTDPSCGQFYYQHSDTEFTFIQAKKGIEEKASRVGANFIEKYSGKVHHKDLYIETIDVSEYTDDEKKDYADPYGEDYTQIPNSLMAEFIFETDIQTEWSD